MEDLFLSINPLVRVIHIYKIGNDLALSAPATPRSLPPPSEASDLEFPQFLPLPSNFSSLFSTPAGIVIVADSDSKSLRQSTPSPTDKDSDKDDDGDPMDLLNQQAYNESFLKQFGR